MAERAILVGVALAGQDPAGASSSLEELARLAESAGAEVAGRVLQQRRGLDPATYIGTGKLEELGKMATAADAGMVVFDDELKPSQLRNIEEALSLKVLDRTQLILDVFATRASTNEGRLQVELAQLSYLLPRLMGMGNVLSRQGGGIGSRGPGESKLESDRRRLRERMAQLSREVDQVSKTRGLQRSKRRRADAKLIALAGYTNAGKSSLFNALTDAKVYAADRLFATLDPTVRSLFPGDKETVHDLLLVDTVGFVRKLPHALVAAFRATLEEVAEADLILRLVDASEPDWEERLASVDAVLEEVFERYLPGKELPPQWLVFNKCDLLGPAKLKALKAQEPEAAQVSALAGSGLQALKLRVRAHFEEDLKVQHYLIPHDRLGELSRHFPKLRIKRQDWLATGLKVEAVLAQPLPALDPFRVKAPKGKA